MDEDELTIRALMEESHTNAVNKGWYDPPKTFTEALALFHSEISEALEEHRDGRGYNEVYWKIGNNTGTAYNNEIWTDDPFQGLPESVRMHLCDNGHAKPEGIPIELADLLIRVADTCKHYEIDLVRALYLKMAYNETRSHRHGDKVV